MRQRNSFRDDDHAPRGAHRAPTAADDAGPPRGRADEDAAASDESAAGASGAPGTDAAEDREAAAREAAAREQLLRLAAEFENFKKRTGRERAETWSRAQADLLEKLLPAVDDLRRVAHPAEAGPVEGPAAALLEGVSLVERKILAALEREGLAEVEAEGAPFDPTVHEAVLTEPTDDPARDGRVARVLQPGFRFGARLLRPAQVAVWKLRD